VSWQEPWKQEAGAGLRFRKVKELAPRKRLKSREGWTGHRLETLDVPVATPGDSEWAVAIILGTPTRYGQPAARPKQFMDTTGPLWGQGKLIDNCCLIFAIWYMQSDPMATKSYSPQDALAKAMSYCAYQERSRKEVREKLHSFGIEDDDEAERILEKLTKDNFLNEERFAKAFAGGKFRMKKWGRVKIRAELKMHGLSAEVIRKGMEEIDPDDYEQTLRDLTEKKNAQEREPEPMLRKQKLIRYLLSKGYEQDLAWDAVNGLEE
jgi:regulatory protein